MHFDVRTTRKSGQSLGGGGGRVTAMILFYLLINTVRLFHLSQWEYNI